MRRGPLPVPGRIQPNKHRKVQLARPGRRKLFNRAAQRVFLEWFAATCNVKWSAEMAGFNYKTVLKHRMTDPVFAEGWDRAVPQAYARFETGRARLAGRFPELEDELAGLTIDGGYEGPGRSPDRADAMVWAMSALMRAPATPRVRFL